MELRMKTWRAWIITLATLVCLAGLGRLYFRLTDDFRVGNITYELPFEAPWKTEPLAAQDQADVDQILNQKFSYLDKGAQCYAFESEDARYVLKFFKFKHLKPNWLVEYLPDSSRKARYLRMKQQKLMNVFNAYDLAYREDKDNVAMLYLHLTPVKNFNKQITVYDKLGLERHIDLNSTVFLIQRKGVTLRAHLNRLLANKDFDAARKGIRQILDMYMSEYKQGIYDRDHGVLVNVGFVEGRPFHLDAGKFAKVERIREKEIYSEDLKLIIWKIEEWLMIAYPEYKDEFFTFMEDQFSELTGGGYDRSKINLELFKTRRHAAVLNP
jgi:hypothetical protein